jgi:hypothetical protein
MVSTFILAAALLMLLPPPPSEQRSTISVELAVALSALMI